MANGKLPKIPRNLKPDLESINTLLSDISTKISSFHQLDDTFKLKIDIQGEDKFETLEKSLRDLNGTTKAAQKINKALVDNLNTRNATEARLNKAMEETGKRLKANRESQFKLDKEIKISNETLEKHAKKIEDVQKKMHKGDKLTKEETKENEKTIKQIDKLTAKIDNKIESISKQHDALAKIKDAEKDENKLLDLQGKAVKELDGKWMTFSKTIGNQVLGALNKLGTGLAALAIDAVFFSLEKLKDGFMAIYDLMERTQKAVGSFNLSMGATTEGLTAARTEAFKLDGTMRALTGGEIGVGLKMWEETSKAIGFVGEGFNQMATGATIAGRAMGIGSATAGELTKTFMAMGASSMKFGDNIEDAATRAGVKLDGLSEKAKQAELTKFAEKLKKETSDSLEDVSAAAGKAGMSVADFGKEIAANKGFMAAFGKAGKKAFLDTVAYVHKLGISAAGLKSFTDLTDTFEGSAHAAAQMNTVFGTSINALDQMLEQDPAKRLDKIKAGMKAQGKEWTKMSRSEQQFFAKSQGLSEDEAAAFMTSNMTKKKFDEQNAKAAKNKISQEETIRKGLAATAETLMNWKQVMDDITGSLKDLYEPILKAVGLMGVFGKNGKRNLDEFGKPMKTFGENVRMVVDKVKDFFQLLAKNDDVKAFIEMVTKDVKGLFGAFVEDGKDSESAMGGLVKTVGDFTAGVSEVYKVGKEIFKEVFTKENIKSAMSLFGSIARNIPTIIKGFLAFKAIVGVGSIVGGINSMTTLLGGTGGTGLLPILKDFGSGLANVAKTAMPTFTSALSKGGDILKGGMSKLGDFMKGDMTSTFGKTSGMMSKLGGVAAVAGAAMAGWEIGRFIGGLEIGGKKIDDHVVDAMESISTGFSNLFATAEEELLQKKGLVSDKGEKTEEFHKLEIAMNRLAGGQELFESDIKQLEKLQRDKDLQEALKARAMEGPAADLNLPELQRKLSKLSSTNLTLALEQARSAKAQKVAAGQAQPAAKATVTGPATAPAQTTVAKPVSPAAGGPTVTSTPVNANNKKVDVPKAEKVSTTAGPITLVAGDVYLDGNLVGRHLLRGASTG